MFTFNDSQLKQVAEFNSNLGLFFIGVVIAPLFSKAGSVNLLSVVLGLVLAVFCLVTSVYILRRVRK